MNITISCAERFHSYDLAYQLQQRHVLDRLITTYPQKEIAKYGIASDHATSLLYWEVLKRSWEKLARWSGSDSAFLYPWLHELFDNAVARRIPDDITHFIGWSARSEHSVKKSKAKGAVTILERGSSHIEVQTELLKEEYDRYLPKRIKHITHPRVIEKELREYDMVDYISVPSTFVKRTFLEKGFAENKLIQNPYGVDITKFGPGSKVDNVFRIVFVGQMTLRKGVHYLLQAFASLKLKNAELLLVGSMTAEIEPFLQQYPDQVRYVGIQPQNKLRDFYNQSSVFIICSIEEGMAMVQAQAAACGLPLICTTNTGGEDLIRDSKEGFVIPIRSIEAIKEKIEWCYLNQEEAFRMGQAARTRVLNGFTWNDYGNRYLSNLIAMSDLKSGKAYNFQHN